MLVDVLIDMKDGRVHLRMREARWRRTGRTSPLRRFLLSSRLGEPGRTVVTLIVISRERLSSGFVSSCQKAGCTKGENGANSSWTIVRRI